MAPVKTSGRRGLEGAAAERLRARLVERGVHIEAAPPPASEAAEPTVRAAAASRPAQPQRRRNEPARIATGGQGGLGLEHALPDDVVGDAATFDAAAGAGAGEVLAEGAADPNGTAPADVVDGATVVAVGDSDSGAAPAAIPLAGAAAPARGQGAEAATLVTPSVTLTSEEEEALLADTVGEQPPEDPRAVAVWEVRRELDAFERWVREQRQSIQERLAAAEEELRAQRRSERVADYARLGLTLSRAGLGWEAVSALRDVPAADLLALVHTLAERGLSVRDLLSRVPPAER